MQEASSKRVGAAALLLAASVFLSRILGYAREALLAYRVGAGPDADAYYAAFQIPDLLNYLLAGGALSIAFLPLYTRRRTTQAAAGSADELLAVVLGTLTGIAVAATAALWWWAPELIDIQFPNFDAPTRALTTRLTRIVLPAQIFFVAGGIVNATLLSHGRFGAAAAAPLLYNGGIIVGGLLLAPLLANPVEGFSWGAMIGAILGPFLAPLIDARGRVRLAARFSPTHRDFLGYLWLAAPLMIGQTLLTVDEWYERWFGGLLEPGTIAHLSYARRLMLVPVAVVGQAIAAAALPAMSRMWADGKNRDLDKLVQQTLQTGVVLAILAASIFFLFAEELVAVIYRRGAFTSEDAVAVSAILAILSLAVPGWITQQIITRAFYARSDTWRPMILGTLFALGAIPLYVFLGNRYGAIGLAAAPAIAMSANALATLVMARIMHGAPDLAALASTGARTLIIAVAAIATVQVVPDSIAALPRAIARATLFATVLGLGTWTIGDTIVRDAVRQPLSAILRRLGTSSGR